MSVTSCLCSIHPDQLQQSIPPNSSTALTLSKCRSIQPFYLQACPAGPIWWDVVCLPECDRGVALILAPALFSIASVGRLLDISLLAAFPSATASEGGGKRLQLLTPRNLPQILLATCYSPSPQPLLPPRARPG